MTQFEKLDLLLRECGGTIQTFQVLNNGISKSVFYAYVKERGLEQASHSCCGRKEDSQNNRRPLSLRRIRACTV